VNREKKETVAFSGDIYISDKSDWEVFCCAKDGCKSRDHVRKLRTATRENPTTLASATKQVRIRNFNCCFGPRFVGIKKEKAGALSKIRRNN
jgi:hypothetical protein